MTVGLPLRRKGGAVRGYVLVDAEDAPSLVNRRWHLTNDYPATKIDGREVYLHRLLCGLEKGDPREVDHRNGNVRDARRANLRVCTRGQNQQNRHYGYGSSRHRGVTWVKGRRKWLARVKLRGRTHQIGYFDDELEAAEAAAKFRAEHLPYATA